MLPGAARGILTRASNVVTAPIASCAALSQITLRPLSGAAWKQDYGKPDRGPLGWDWLGGNWNAVDRASVARSVGETASRPQPVNIPRIRDGTYKGPPCPASGPHAPS